MGVRARVRCARARARMLAKTTRMFRACALDVMIILLSQKKQPQPHRHNKHHNNNGATVCGVLRYNRSKPVFG